MAAERGWLFLCLLRHEDRLAAFEFDLLYGSTLYNLKVAFDPEFGRFGPGNTLKYWLLVSPSRLIPLSMQGMIRGKYWELSFPMWLTMKLMPRRIVVWWSMSVESFRIFISCSIAISENLFSLLISDLAIPYCFNFDSRLVSRPWFPNC